MTRGPVWFATPSLQETFTLTILPAYPGASPHFFRIFFYRFHPLLRATIHMVVREQCTYTKYTKVRQVGLE